MRSLFLQAVVFWVALFLSVLLPLSSLAQTPGTPEFLAEVKALLDKDPAMLTEAEKAALFPYVGPLIEKSPVGTPTNTVNCFDYYRFGSVQVDLSPLLEQIIPGAPLTFTGELKNENSYPIVDGSVYVKIFKLDSAESEETHQNGYPLVAFFEAGKNIQLPASGSAPFTFEWAVPQTLSGGEYEASFFFVTNHRFNLLGLSFTDDVTGNKASFHVTSPNTDQVVFDKHAITLNDEPYRFAAFPPRIDIDTPGVIEAVVVNPSDMQKIVTLTWQLYNWDGLREDFLLDTHVESITVPANAKKTVSYTAQKQMGTVSYVIGTVQDGDATSIINPRFVRQNIEETRLNFPSLLKFPLQSGEENTVFSCVHSTNVPLVSDNVLTMTLTDEAGDIIHKYSYEGDVTGAMMGVADTFTPTRSYGHVTLTTTLSRQGEIVDSVAQTYDCAVLSPENCPQSDKNTVATTATASKDTLVAAVIGVLLAVILGSAVFLFIRDKRRRDDIVVTNPTND